MRGPSKKCVALTAAACTLLIGLVVSPSYAMDAPADKAQDIVNTQDGQSAQSNQNVPSHDSKMTDSSNQGTENSSVDNDSKRDSAEKTGSDSDNSKTEVNKQSDAADNQKKENKDAAKEENDKKGADQEKHNVSRQLSDLQKKAQAPATTSENGNSRNAANARTLQLGTYYSNLSSAASSEGHNIAAGTYYVTGNDATGYINIDVCSYSPATDGTWSCDSYNVGYYGGASFITVNKNERVRITSSNSKAKTFWQMRKKTGEGTYTPSSSTTRVVGRYYSDISSKSSYGIQPGLYFVKWNSLSYWNEIVVCDYDVAKDETSNCTYYTPVDQYNGADTDVSEVQVGRNQRVEVQESSTVWSVLSYSSAGTQYSPGKAFMRSNGNYYSLKDNATIPTGRFLVRSDREKSVEVCYYHVTGDETSNCRNYNIGGNKGAAEIRVYPSQRVQIGPWWDTSGTTYWNPLSVQSNVKKYQIKFDSRGGSKVNAQTVQQGKKATKPANPTRAGYTFRTWTTDGAGKNVYNFNSPVNGNRTLYAQWTGRYYTIYFDAKGGKASAKSKRVKYGSAYGSLPSASRKGYTFKGWYTAQGNKVTSKTIVGMASNRTFHAVWVKK